MSDDSKLRAYLFTVEIDGIETARFQKCEGLEAETYVYEVEKGGLNHTTRKFRGRTRFPNLILEKGITENDSLFNWFKETCLENKKLERKNGSVVLKDTEGNEVKRWNFFRAFPCRWIGPKLVTNLGSDFAVERIEIAHEGIEVDNDSDEPQINTNVITPIQISPQTATNENDYHCDIYSWNQALDSGADPRDQNGEEWDGNMESVSQIYNRYPNNRHIGTPPSNSRGYSFYDSPNDNDNIPEHMEFYDASNSADGSYTLYRTNGIEEPIPEQRNRIDNRRTFVPLNDLPGGSNQ